MLDINFKEVNCFFQKCSFNSQSSKVMSEKSESWKTSFWSYCNVLLFVPLELRDFKEWFSNDGCGNHCQCLLQSGFLGFYLQGFYSENLGICLFKSHAMWFWCRKYVDDPLKNIAFSTMWTDVWKYWCTNKISILKKPCVLNLLLIERIFLKRTLFIKHHAFH